MENEYPTEIENLKREYSIKLEALSSQLVDSNASISLLKDKLAAKENEISEAKLVLSNSGNDEDELNRLQMMLFELKTTRADLLEKLDNSEYEISILKQEIASLKNE